MSKEVSVVAVGMCTKQLKDFRKNRSSLDKNVNFLSVLCE